MVLCQLGSLPIAQLIYPLHNSYSGCGFPCHPKLHYHQFFWTKKSCVLTSYQTIHTGGWHHLYLEGLNKEPSSCLSKKAFSLLPDEFCGNFIWAFVCTDFTDIWQGTAHFNLLGKLPFLPVDITPPIHNHKYEQLAIYTGNIKFKFINITNFSLPANGILSNSPSFLSACLFNWQKCYENNINSKLIASQSISDYCQFIAGKNIEVNLQQTGRFIQGISVGRANA